MALPHSRLLIGLLLCAFYWTLSVTGHSPASNSCETIPEDLSKKCYQILEQIYSELPSKKEQGEKSAKNLAPALINFFGDSSRNIGDFVGGKLPITPTDYVVGLLVLNKVTDPPNSSAEQLQNIVKKSEWPLSCRMLAWNFIGEKGAKLKLVEELSEALQSGSLTKKAPKNQSPFYSDTTNEHIEVRAPLFAMARRYISMFNLLGTKLTTEEAKTYEPLLRNLQDKVISRVSDPDYPLIDRFRICFCLRRDNYGENAVEVFIDRMVLGIKDKLAGIASDNLRKYFTSLREGIEELICFHDRVKSNRLNNLVQRFFDQMQLSTVLENFLKDADHEEQMKIKAVLYERSQVKSQEQGANTPKSKKSINNSKTIALHNNSKSTTSQQPNLTHDSAIKALSELAEQLVGGHSLSFEESLKKLSHLVGQYDSPHMHDGEELTFSRVGLDTTVISMVDLDTTEISSDLCNEKYENFSPSKPLTHKEISELKEVIEKHIKNVDFSLLKPQMGEAILGLVGKLQLENLTVCKSLSLTNESILDV